MTQDNLKNRNIHGPSKCVLCNQLEETLTHLLLHYSFTVQVWEFSLQELDIYNFVPPWTCKKMFLNWDHNKVVRENRNHGGSFPNLYCEKLGLLETLLFFIESKCKPKSSLAIQNYDDQSHKCSGSRSRMRETFEPRKDKLDQRHSATRAQNLFSS